MHRRSTSCRGPGWPTGRRFAPEVTPALCLSGPPPTGSPMRYPAPSTVWISGYAEPLVDLLAQPVDMHVDDIAARLEIVVPCAFQQHRPGDDLAGVADQIFQQQQFPAAAAESSCPSRVALRASVSTCRSSTRSTADSAGAIGPARQRFEPGEDLGEGIRLHEVVVAARLHALHPVRGAPMALNTRIGVIASFSRRRRIRLRPSSTGRRRSTISAS